MLGTRKKAEVSPVRAALDTPLPAGIASRQTALNKAREAFHAAESARDNARSTGLEEAKAGVNKTRRALDTAIVQREVADRLGDDDDGAPTHEAISALEDAYEAALAKLASLESAGSSYDGEVERRRSMLDNAASELQREFQSWRRGVEEAADRQLEQAIFALGEARAALTKLNPFATTSPPLHERRVFQPADAYLYANYDYPESVTTSAEINDVLQSVARADRDLLRLPGVNFNLAA